MVCTEWFQFCKNIDAYIYMHAFFKKRELGYMPKWSQQNTGWVYLFSYILNVYPKKQVDDTWALRKVSS